MIIKHEEPAESDFEGTVIDIETIGNFNRLYDDDDSRRCKDIQLVIFGFINRQALQILCAEGKGSINELKEEVRKIIQGLERPLYAFNSGFERGVLFHNLGMEIDFDGELQKRPRETKAGARGELNIPNYDDPFFDSGYRCMIEWEKGEFDNTIAHNRACLLKERDILLKRGFREPDEIRFVRE
jgi:hypothetical protein